MNKLFTPVLASLIFILLFVKIPFEGNSLSEGFVDGALYSLVIVLTASLVVMVRKSIQ
ncbi:hypothetical protein ACWV26_10530 [Rummeliibacillus sp. JY-2-4R]